LLQTPVARSVNLKAGNRSGKEETREEVSKRMTNPITLSLVGEG